MKKFKYILLLFYVHLAGYDDAVPGFTGIFLHFELDNEKAISFGAEKYRLK